MKNCIVGKVETFIIYEYLNKYDKVYFISHSDVQMILLTFFNKIFDTRGGGKLVIKVFNIPYILRQVQEDASQFL